MANSFVKIGSYFGNTIVGQDLIPAIQEDIINRFGIQLSKNLKLRHISIFSDDGDIYTVNGFDFIVINGNFSSAMIGGNIDNISIESIIPQQDGECIIYYLR